MSEIQLTQEEIEELMKFSLHKDILKDMMDHVFDRMEDCNVKTIKLQRIWWLKIAEKYNLDLKEGKYIADSLRGVIKIKEIKDESNK